jgi:hypothetical protein
MPSSCRLRLDLLSNNALNVALAAGIAKSTYLPRLTAVGRNGGGSDWVGGSGCKNGNFRKAGTTPTKTFR